MGSGTRRSLFVALAFVAVLGAGWGAGGRAGATARRVDDLTIARAGLLGTADFPAGFNGSPSTTSSHRDNLQLARGVEGCNAYRSLQKSTTPLPQATSLQYDGGQRSISNEVDVFPSAKAASAALTLYAKPSVAGCLEQLFEKRLEQDPKLRARLDDVTVQLDRQAIAGLGDDSVVYEGSLVLTGTDGSRRQVGIGTAAVRVGRAVDAVSYSTEGADLTGVLTPAIDASVARVRTALARSSS
jgi:hypothetical protein